MMAGIGARQRATARDGGAAAIEFAIIFPILAMVLLAMTELSLALKEQRRLSYSASVLADLVTRKENTIGPADIEDYFKAVALAMRPRPAGEVRAEVTAYRQTGQGEIRRIWARRSGGGPDCGPPDTAWLGAVMTDGNDAVIARVCALYQPLAISVLAPGFSQGASVTISRQFILRPRASLTLNCSECPAQE